MKNWFIAALVTSVFVVPMIMRKRNEKIVPVPTEENERYTTDDFIADEEL